jgi:hypothetical protein
MPGGRDARKKTADWKLNIFVQCTVEWLSGQITQKAATSAPQEGKSCNKAKEMQKSPLHALASAWGIRPPGAGGLLGKVWVKTEGSP